MTYNERMNMRRNVLEEFFSVSNPIENKVMDTWQKENYIPSSEENKETCGRICKAAQTIAKKAFKGQDDLYKRFFRECEEITARFQKLNAKTAIEASCGVYQVSTYLYDEIFDLVGEAVGI